jgi:iron complex outermembrane recepter protein
MDAAGEMGMNRILEGSARLLLGSAFVALALGAQSAMARQTSRIAVELPPQALSESLRNLAIVTGRSVLVDAVLVGNRPAPAVRGSYTVEESLRLLLSGSGLNYQRVGDGFVIVSAAALTADGPNASSDIVVTGTRIRGSVPVGAPVVVLNRDALDRSGRGSMTDIIQSIPQNFNGGASETTIGTTARNGAGANISNGSSINLRGLGTASTLVLFDGNRPALGGTTGTFTDISLIPVSAIDRIEILTDGASAIYGTDAVAGVVNIRFRNRFEGFETSLRSGTVDGDFGELQLSQIAGKSWSSGGVVLAYQYSERGRLRGADRAFATEDLRPYGGPDYRSLYASPGTIIAANGAVFGIPQNQSGTALRASDLLPGQVNRRDARKTIDLLPQQISNAVYGSFDQDILPGIRLFARGLYAHRSFDVQRPLGFPEIVTVPVSNAFYIDPIGTRQPVRVRYDFTRDFGQQRQTGAVDGLSVTAGLTGAFGRWNYEISGTYGSQIERYVAINAVNTARLAVALADSNRATAFNVFGDGSFTSPATIDQVRGGSRQRTRYAVESGAARLDGPLFDLPWGAVKLAVGAEHRDERLDFSQTSDIRRLQPNANVISGLPGHRKIDAFYGELLIPVSAGGQGLVPGKLDIALAGRIERYSDFGQTANPKVGITWQPTDGISLRSSYGTSFRAPNFPETAGASGNLYTPLLLDDPNSPTGKTLVLGLFGLSSTIGPEKATSWTVGVDLKSLPITGLTLSATYFKIAYKDRIGSASADYLSFLTRRDLYGSLVTDNPSAAIVAGYFADPGFFNGLGVAPGDIKAIIDGLTRNLSAVTVRGVDFDIGLKRPIVGGTVDVGVAGTYLLGINQQVTPTAPAANVLSSLGNPTDLRLRGRAGWSKGNFDIGAFVNYVAGYQNQTTTPTERVSSWTTVDLQVGYRFADTGPFKNARIALSATNLFDQAPPYVNNHAFDSTLAYDPEQASPVGRLISIQARFGW